jgi:hypothetical protein
MNTQCYDRDLESVRPVKYSLLDRPQDNYNRIEFCCQGGHTLALWLTREQAGWVRAALDTLYPPITMLDTPKEVLDARIMGKALDTLYLAGPVPAPVTLAPPDETPTEVVEQVADSYIARAEAAEFAATHPYEPTECHEPEDSTAFTRIGAASAGKTCAINTSPWGGCHTLDTSAHEATPLSKAPSNELKTTVAETHAHLDAVSEAHTHAIDFMLSKLS